MEVFRISAEKYSNKLSSSGSANRWNEEGQFVLYTGSSRSLSTLELVVHRSSIEPSIKYKVMVVHIPDDEKHYKQISINTLPENWQSVSAYPALQKIGSMWYVNKESLILKIPSAVIPKEHNYIINTNHPKFSSLIKLTSTEEYFWDSRLL